jgi:hypothetical protein
MSKNSIKKLPTDIERYGTNFIKVIINVKGFANEGDLLSIRRNGQ